MEKNRVTEAVRDIRRGKMVIVVDDRDRENEGDLILAAEHANARAINFMITEARGLVCLTLTSDRAKALKLAPMVKNNTARHHTNFTVSVDAAKGITTGISVRDRALTIATALNPHSRPQDLHRPGHVFPLVAARGGVLERAGHTEASIELATLAGCTPAGVLCEILNARGESAHGADLKKFAERHGLIVLTIMELVQFLRTNKKLV